MDLPTAAGLKELVSAFAPGIIILSMRQRFLAGPIPNLQQRAISYAAVSAIYYAIFDPCLSYFRTEQGLLPWFSNAFEYFVLPAAIGALVAIATSKDWEEWLWRKLGLQPVHLIPTAWDYTFSRLRRETYVVVTLSDGSTVAGLYGENSFASSSRDERDVLIGEVWEEQDGQWTPPATPKSILICGRDIRSVELFR